jgi:hypothetical protein
MLQRLYTVIGIGAMEDKALSTAAANGIFETKEEAEKAAEAIAKEHVQDQIAQAKEDGEDQPDFVLVEVRGQGTWDIYENDHLVSRYEAIEIRPHDL